jgi:hypothetical protein
MKTSNEDFLEKLAREALKKANIVDTGEPKLVWPKPEEVRCQKPYPVPKEGLVVPKGEMKQSSPKSYPIEQEVISQA